MNRTHGISFVTATLMGCVVLAGGNARAEEPTIRVSYADLDMSKPADVKTLYGRIHTAAGRYCEALFTRTGSRISSGYAGCVDDAVGTTVRSLNVPSLSALHADKAAPQRKS